MVDAIGSSTVTASDLRGASPIRVAPAPAAPAAPSPDTQALAATLSRQLASSAPVDQERVAAIKRAIANGTFPILPATIADRLLALKLEWSSRDPA